MSYTPTEWETADIVTAQRMNALETAVGDMNMSYTPNTWSDGDILSAAKMNALEQAVASGGGGGSSDFSTAEVTIINSASDYRVVLIATVQEAFPPFVPSDLVASSVTLAGDETAVFTMPLYKGLGVITKGNTGDTFYGDTIATTLAVTSGSATVDDNDDIQVTGDCTITIS